jgi:hypothetical protein
MAVAGGVGREFHAIADAAISRISDVILPILRGLPVVDGLLVLL